MEALILFAIVVIVLPLILSCVAITRSGRVRSEQEELLGRVLLLERELRELRRASREETSPISTAKSAPAAGPVAPAAELPLPAAPISAPAPAEAARTPPPFPRVVPQPNSAPISAPAAPRSPLPVAAAAEPQASTDWEQFMGAKLFAWIGGLALFLGVAFFIKYSFEHNLIPPAMRVAIGFATGVVLLGGGVAMKRKDYAVTAQTLCATGVLVLYATTFASHGFYHFPFFTPLITFALMTLITAVAFALAVKMEAQVVADLGMLGGFLTPILLSTGEDKPVALFSYIALLNAGLIAVALQRRWHYLVPLAALGTTLMEVGWVEQFFISGRYAQSNLVLLPMGLFVGLLALFVGAVWWGKRRAQLSLTLSAAALALALVGFGFGFYFLFFDELAARPALLFGFVLIVDLAVLGVAWLDARIAPAQPAAGLLAFVLLAIWTHSALTPALLYTSLALYFVFTLLHAIAPLALQHWRSITVEPWWSHIFPAMGLLLVFLPILRGSDAAGALWPYVLLVDLLAIVLAIVSGALVPIAAVLVLTLVVIGALIFKIPASLVGLPTILTMLGFFAPFFFGASIWATRRLANSPTRGSPAGTASFLLPGASAALPFLLLIMVVVKLPLANPTPVFALALLLVLLLLGGARWLRADALPIVALISTAGLAHAWHFHHFVVATSTLPLLWYLGFYAIFLAFPFLFRAHFRTSTAPWAAAALAGPLLFPVVHRLIASAWPQLAPGLIPAAFAVPSLLAVWSLAKDPHAENPARNSQFAWFGGVTLFFVTLIFPLQFHREWVTIGWALEGAALCWLFHRVPHPGLRMVGVALLSVAFVRLALNPAVLGYHERSTPPIFNWYLYAYGLVIACLFSAARLLAPPRNLVLGSNVPPFLYTLGTVLAFILVNLQIADYCTAPGATVTTLQFSGNLARDMSYSIAWALFALMLVIIGIHRRQAPIRYAGLGLLSVTLLKLFFHDLSQLGQLYRIGALVAVALIAMLASFLYQRFLAASARENELAR